MIPEQVRQAAKLTDEQCAVIESYTQPAGHKFHAGPEQIPVFCWLSEPRSDTEQLREALAEFPQAWDEFKAGLSEPRQET